MTKFRDIQKDIILFFIILVFVSCFVYWRDVSKEDFITTPVNQSIINSPVLDILPSWTNSIINGGNIEIKWKDLNWDTHVSNISSKNSEFSLTFSLFLGGRKVTPQPIFRIIDTGIIDKKNSPGIWLTENYIQIKNDSSPKILKTTLIPLQSLDFYTIVFTSHNYSIYINGELPDENEKWNKPGKINQELHAYLEIATAATQNHYAMKNVKLYNEIFDADTVKKIYELSKETNKSEEREKVINAIGGLPVINASDWVFFPTEDRFDSLGGSNNLYDETKNLIGNWSESNIENSATMSISFWIFISDLHTNWRNIIHVTNDGHNCCSPGNRVPAIWIYPNSTMVHFRHSTETNGNDGPHEHSYKIPMNTATFFTIVLNRTTMTSYANGIQIEGLTKTFSSPLVPADSTAKFYMGNPWAGFGGFKIKNFKLYNTVFSAMDVFDLYSSESVVP